MTENKRSFRSVFWPSLLAGLIVSILFGVLFVLITLGVIGSLTDLKPDPFLVKQNSILHITLDGEIAELSDRKFDKSALSFEKKIGLNELLYGFKKAKSDKKIKGIFIDIKDLNCGYSSAREIRNAINDFEKSGKFAVAYNSGELITQKEYYIASAANENYGFPSSTIEFIGMGAELLFFKNTLEKLDLEIQVVRGKNNDFKSAVEPFFRDQMSDSSRLQIQKYLSSMWLDIREDISKDRNIEMQQLNKLAENVTIRKLSDAVKYHLIDAVKYKDEVIDLLKKKVNISGNDDLKLIAFEKYSNKSFLKSQLINKLEDPNIAVIVAEGEISVDGDGMTSKKIVQLFQDVRKNKTIKTVVFRINSPGGSALASEEIWREVKLTNAIKKVIVSMGNVAASGGYYVASPATKIFAEPTTITGSIGVFGVVPYTGDFFKNKLGLTFDRVSTNKHSIVSLNRKLTSEEINLIQSEIDEIYMQFMMKVSAGRRMSIDQVNKIARGRVWTGRDALKIGLVDNLGGITDAVNYAAKISNISEQKVLFYPLQEEDPIAELIEKFEDQDALTTSESKIPSSIINYYNQLKKIESLQGVQMRLPFEIDIK